MSAIADADEQMPVEAYSETAAHVFAERVLRVLNDAALGLVLCLAHRTGLLDALVRLREGSCERIAEEAGLSVSSVRDSLAALTHGRILIYEPLERTYRLPAEHAAHLVRSKCTSLAVAAESLSLLAGVELLESLRFGGAPPARDGLERIGEVLRTSWEANILDAISVVRGANEKLRAGASVLESDCGRGAALVTLAGEFPNSRFVGIHARDSGVEIGRARTRELGSKNAVFRVGKITDVAEDRAHDLVLACRSLHDGGDLPLVLAHIHRTLKADGTLLMRTLAGSSRLDNNLNRPAAALISAISLVRGILASSLQQSSISGHEPMTGHEPMMQLLHDIGFRYVRVVELPHDPLNVYFVCEKM